MLGGGVVSRAFSSPVEAARDAIMAGEGWEELI